MDKLMFLFLLSYLTLQVTASRKISVGCLQCICEAFYGCSIESECKLRVEQDLCGPYQLTREYWTEAGLDLQYSMFGTYEKCSKNLECSEKVIQEYVSRNIRDCDGNGFIDCRDIALVHYFGELCTARKLRSSAQWLSFSACNRIIKPSDRWYNVPAVTPEAATTKKQFYVPPGAAQSDTGSVGRTGDNVWETYGTRRPERAEYQNDQQQQHPIRSYHNKMMNDLYNFLQNGQQGWRISTNG